MVFDSNSHQKDPEKKEENHLKSMEKGGRRLNPREGRRKLLLLQVETLHFALHYYRDFRFEEQNLHLSNKLYLHGRMHYSVSRGYESKKNRGMTKS